MQMSMFSDQAVEKSAIMSRCGHYRYLLSRNWDGSLPIVAFIGLNPSTADHRNDDPTTRVCINYAKRWGYGGLFLANLFSYRSTDPDNLYSVDDPIGPRADRYLSQIVKEADLVICCWTSRGALMGRDREVYRKIPDPHCLAILGDGSPGHPLYKSALLKPMRYERSERRAI